MASEVKQEDWEDLESEEDTLEIARESDQRHSGSDAGSLRKRAPRRAPPSSPLSKSIRERKPATRSRTRTRRSDSKPRRNEAVSSLSLFTVTYVVEVLRFALVIVRKPLSLILVVYLLAILVSHLQATIGATIRSTLAPICQLPGVSRVALCHTLQTNHAVNVPQRADYPKLVDIQSATFEQLLDDSIGGAALALEIKKAEMATGDLTTLVRTSHLTSRDQMAEMLSGFVEGARRTGRGLQKFSAKVGGAVDGVIAVNDYALKRIEQAASASSSPSLWRAILVPFSSRSSSSVALVTSFKQAMAMLDSELHTLILAAETSLHDLDTLEEQLNVLHGMVSREDVSLSESKQELLSKLWTIVGGNRAELRRFDSHLLLLSGLGEYRQKALAHVVGALQTLQAMTADLETLRERVSEPALMSRDIIPLEVHVKSIRGGLERLTEGRLRAKRIEDARYAKLAAPLSG